MRTTNIGSALIEYPDELIWKQDSTAIRVSGVQNIGATIVIANPEQNYYVLEYYSDQDELLFYLDDAIRALWTDNIAAWYCKVIVYSNEILVGTAMNFNFNVLDGKSFISRSHGISSTIYVYDPSELYKLQVFSPQQGIVSCGQFSSYCYYGLNQYNLMQYITQEGEYQLCLRDSNQVPAQVNISGDIPVDPNSSIITFSVLQAPVNQTYGGDVFSPNKVIFPICHKIIFQDHCDDYNFGEIAYTDLDGMRRYLGGKVIQDKDEVKSESYFTSNVDIYNRIPNRYLTSHEKTLTLYLSDIEKNAYPHDLIYSQSMQYKGWDGQWRPCALKTSQLIRKDEDYYDIELEIIISQ